MKKFVKSLSFVLVFALVTLLVPALFAGCAKTYIVNMEFVDGNQNGGYVFYSRSPNSESAYGRTAVKAGDTYEVRIVPQTGYYIKAISVNNSPYGKVFNQGGYTFAEVVEGDTNVLVEFAKSEYIVHLKASTYNAGSEFTGYEDYVYRPDGVNQLSVLHGERLTLAEFGTNDQGDGVFFYFDSRGARVRVNPNVGIVFRDPSRIFYTEKTAEELDEILRPEHNIMISDVSVYSGGASVGDYGTITYTPDGINHESALGNRKLKEGHSFSFTITPQAGYKLGSILVNGSPFTGTYDVTGTAITIPATNTIDLVYQITFVVDE